MKILIKTLVLCAFLFSSNVGARITTVLHPIAAASCNGALDAAYFFAEFQRLYGPPDRIEGDAFWFKAKGSMYGVEIHEFFVSSTPTWDFVGVVFKADPDTLAANIQTSKFLSANMYRTSDGWNGSDGRRVVWHKGKYAKMFCAIKYIGNR